MQQHILKSGGIFKYNFVANLLQSLPAKEFWKSVNIWGNHGQEFNVLVFDWLCIFSGYPAKHSVQLSHLDSHWWPNTLPTELLGIPVSTAQSSLYARVVASQVILGIFQKFSFSPGFEPGPPELEPSGQPLVTKHFTNWATRHPTLEKSQVFRPCLKDSPAVRGGRPAESSRPWGRAQRMFR